MNIDWQKCNGLVPVIVQDDLTHQVLMLGYMNEQALQATLDTNIITFFSRTKNRLWTKGETSGNSLSLISLHIDCDFDTILCRVKPKGPVCHTGDMTCFHDDHIDSLSFLRNLGILLQQRNAQRPPKSYTTSLFESGKARIAQKVGEEGVELSLAHMKQDSHEILNESADLLFHMMVLLEDAGLSLDQVCKLLKERHHAS